MKKFKKLLVSITFAFALLLALPAVLPHSGIITEVQAAQHTQKSYTIFVGNAFTIAPNIGTSKQWQWSSSNPSVATVTYDSSKGKYKITAVGHGTATIKGAYGSNTISYYITVAKLSTYKTTIYKGSTHTLSVSGSPTSITWSSDNTSVATVNSKGKITAKKAGTAKITARVYSKIGTASISKKLICTVTVKNKQTAAQTNLNLLKTKISKSSYVNSKGNHYIKSSTLKNKTTSTYVIAYDKAKDRLQFTYKMKDSSSKKERSISFYVYNTTKTYKIAPVISATTPKGVKFKTKTSLDYRTLTSKTNIAFSITSSNVKLTSSVKKGMQTISNACLQDALAGWNSLIKSKSGLTLKNIGFTSYK